MSRQFSLIGEHLPHTMSPFIHKRLFDLSECDGEYSTTEINREKLGEIYPALRSLTGYNITIPHKISIIPFLDSLDESAKLFGAVNCVHNTETGATGYNTDAFGFIRVLGENKSLLSEKVLLLGAGGAGTMMAYETAVMGGELTIAVREQSVHKALKLKDEVISKHPDSKVSVTSLDKINGNFDILLNSTPVGMFPDINSCPVSDSVIDSVSCVFDAIYNPVNTVLLKKARQLSKTAIGGSSMLVWQAAASHEIWDNVSYNEVQINQLISEVEITVKRVF